MITEYFSNLYKSKFLVVEIMSGEKLKFNKHLKEEFYKSKCLNLFMIPKSSLLKRYKHVNDINGDIIPAGDNQKDISLNHSTLIVKLKKPIENVIY